MDKQRHQHGGPRKGAGRPPAPEDERLIAKTLRMTDAEWEQVAAAAEQMGVSVNEIIRRLVRGM